MKKNLYLFLVLSFFAVSLAAQDSGKTIIEDLNTSKWGQGRVKVMQDDAVQSILGVRQFVDTSKMLGVLEPAASYKKIRGYKIQVYSGNNQKRSKAEAESRQAQVRNAFPELEADVSTKPPFWRLRVGHFFKREDAEKVLAEMKKTLPGLAREMYVVPDEIKYPAE